MKRFLVAFTLGVAISGLFFIRLNHINQVPPPLQSYAIESVDAYRTFLVWLRDDLFKGIWVPHGVEVRSLLAGLAFFLGLWFILAILRGIPGFFRDLSAFFPLRG